MAKDSSNTIFILFILLFLSLLDAVRGKAAAAGSIVVVWRPGPFPMDVMDEKHSAPLQNLFSRICLVFIISSDRSVCKNGRGFGEAASGARGGGDGDGDGIGNFSKNLSVFTQSYGFTGPDMARKLGQLLTTDFDGVQSLKNA
ncbi:MAG: hypothetical protein SOR93_19305 [Clostridiales Family XIII bacterium]|nr:hypothetical protein [Clostridia bacterium]MDY3013390.1 hypothetical protein [Clostridiales Family XIII bacterium]